MKKSPKLKALALSVAMTLGMLSPMTMKAQFTTASDGFFASSRDMNPAAWTITMDSFTDAPLGSGLLILTAVGAGYVALKKKEERQ